MTKEEAWRILEHFKNWSVGQTSVDLACDGIRTPEDDVLDARRALVMKAYEVLRQ